MTTSYWNQFSAQEINDMHEITSWACNEFEDQEAHSIESEFDCKRCQDNGCNYCLMCSY